MKRNKDYIKKIEIDEKTAELKIVKVPADSVKDDNPEPKINKADFFEQKKSAKSIGKQLIIPNLSGKKAEEDSVSKRQRIFKNVFVILFVVFVVGVLAFTFYNDFFAPSSNRHFPSWEELVNIFSVGWMYLLAALVALFLCYLFKALKLSVICKALTRKAHFKTCFETGIIGLYYNFVTPLAVGGQPFEIYHLSKHGVHGGVAAALPISTYVLNQFAFVISGTIFLVMFETNTLGIHSALIGAFPIAFKVLAIAGLIMCALMPLFVVIFSLTPRFGSKLVHFVVFIGAKLRIVKDPKKTTYKTIKNIIQNAQCIKKIFKKPIPALASFFISFLEHFASASIAYFSLKAFGFPTYLNDISFGMEWLQVIQLVIILSCAVSFVPTPGNSGAADLSFYMLFTVGLASGLAFPAMVLWRILSYYSFIIIGFIFATVKKKADKKRELSNLPLE